MSGTVTVPIEDYALLSNCHTAALVSREGGIDWLCLPRLDSASVFGALLGTEQNGCWNLRPHDANAVASRRYDGDTFILVTRWETATGVAEVHDVMPIHRHSRVDVDRIDLVRRIVGIEGSVAFDQDVRFRFDYSRALPWVRQDGTEQEPALVATAGPHAIVMRGARLHPVDHVHSGEVTVDAGASVDLTLTWYPSHLPVPEPLDVEGGIADTRRWWQDWADRIEHAGPHQDLVVRSLLTLRALTNRETGGIAAAATTSLPEDFGGSRNWDYRYVWLRDAALTLEALLAHGFTHVAHHWRNWLLRAVAGDPADLQIMYGLAGERDLVERELASLPGYEESVPVRIGNGAALQYQADVVGEVLVTLSAARGAGLEESKFSWPLEKHLIRHAAENLQRPDQGLWEIRGDPHMFTHSRVMVWAAFDRAVRAVEEFGLSGHLDEWRELRDRMRHEIDTQAVVDGHFSQYYGTTEVDASLLLLPLVGYCPPDDPRMLATVAKIEQDLMEDGMLRRYRTVTKVDGLPGREHPFLACSFWLVEQYATTGRVDEAEALMDRLCAIANDVGLLSEEYDVHGRRQVGNTPQAFSHLALVRAADALARAEHRPR
ncbi:glycoside hydrolase family 15 protein [Microbacterium sp. ASV49]|uniref:Glycoside hydrolase family 15 protein n=1 Tax=Microbacterium candidum TaxID=3041922 RepID=A0ABT7N4C2_9MICO|nr:glycoside hydrolase family 15 protein [Microbacterium sp. ASV49]MDL9981511.1 glycoside hydrolase family 15 protein [Microbacterium sp. ASV49]